ncbi:endonuclease [Chryseobacterium potabilaquae]|uniref:Extracellular ribonuclease n=1 Tax=Chryseobacterium potabilaquae TaxID=2675057 RepID=A0A6N4X6Q5_9FLAO|nr:endonuclease [Chryseobacterium potabilaquae]CAA7193831.1 Extracellular ribonuclease [Chryseobacterium potabilaquae]
MKKHLLPIILFAQCMYGQAPSGYYNGTTGLTGYVLKSKLHDIISKKHISWHYDDLPGHYAKTDLDRYYDHDGTNTTILLDPYSEKPNGADAYEYTTNDLIGSATAEGQGWNREHMMPQSTFHSHYPMHSDLFYVVPTDARINQLRKNYPYGISSSTPSKIFYTFSNTSKIGKSSIPNYAYTGRVYEPIDEFKGDIARCLLYFAVRYEGKLGTFNYNNNTSSAADTNPLDGTEEQSFDAGYIKMLIQWHTQDPVSQREIDRNNAVYAIQKNRNPFIDRPEWVQAIWKQVDNNTIPRAPINVKVTQTGAHFVTLNWSQSSNEDIIGYKIYQNGTFIASTKETSISIDHLEPSNNYRFTVKAYNNSYLYSDDSNSVSVNTLAYDIYSKDLFISKYILGTSNNKAIEITNKTGHAVNLSDYKLSIQLMNGNDYYYPAPYELEGTVRNNESFVIMNPYANFSCYTIDQSKLVSAAPQMSFTGSQYLELQYKSSTIDAIGRDHQDNSHYLSNVSLYRKDNVSQPTNSFDFTEWNTYESNYCKDLGGVLLTSDIVTANKEFIIYPNPVVENLFVEGEVGEIKTAQVLDFQGRVIYTEQRPFKNKKYITVGHLQAGSYLLKIDHKVYQLIKK